jgi:hypothetical protein
MTYSAACSEVPVLRSASSSPSCRRHSPRQLLVGAEKGLPRSSRRRAPHSASRRCRVRSPTPTLHKEHPPPLLAPRSGRRPDTQQGTRPVREHRVRARRTRDWKRVGLVRRRYLHPQAGEDINRGERIAHPRRAPRWQHSRHSTVPAPPPTRIRDRPRPDHEPTEAVKIDLSTTVPKPAAMTGSPAGSPAARL